MSYQTDDQTRILGLTITWFGVVLAAVIAVVVLCVGAWKLSWFTADKNAQQQGKVNSIQASAAQHGYANQTANESRLANDLQILSGLSPTDPAAIERIKGVGSDACTAAAQIDPVNDPNEAWVRANCMGTVLRRNAAVLK